MTFDRHSKSKLRECVRWGMGHLIRRLPDRVLMLAKEAPVLRDLDYPGLRLSCHSWDEYQVRPRTCHHDPEMPAWIESFQKGAVFYDIGANSGAYSLVAWQNGIKIVAFEPAPANYRSLVENCYYNKADIQTFPIALNNVTGIHPFHLSSLLPAAALHASGEALDFHHKPFKPLHSFPMITYRLDDFVGQWNLAPPLYVKIDVDGIELKILEGMGALLHKVKSILVEIEAENPQKRQIVECLKNHGLYLTQQAKHGQSFCENWIFTRC